MPRMKEYTVTLHGWALVNGSVSVEASSPAAAIRKAKEDIGQASWPVDECGDNVTPSEGVAASYVRDEDGREEWPEEDAPPPADPVRDAAPDMLAALKLLRGDIEIVAAMAKMPLPDAAHLADEAIAKAEGRAND